MICIDCTSFYFIQGIIICYSRYLCGCSPVQGWQQAPLQAGSSFWQGHFTFWTLSRSYIAIRDAHCSPQEEQILVSLSPVGLEPTLLSRLWLQLIPRVIDGKRSWVPPGSVPVSLRLWVSWLAPLHAVSSRFDTICGAQTQLSDLWRSLGHLYCPLPYPRPREGRYFPNDTQHVNGRAAGRSQVFSSLAQTLAGIMGCSGYVQLGGGTKRWEKSRMWSNAIPSPRKLHFLACRKGCWLQDVSTWSSLAR